MTILSVTYEAGEVYRQASEPIALPEFFYLNWRETTDPMTFWYLDDGERILHQVDPGFTPRNSRTTIHSGSNLQLAHWPEHLYFLWLDRSVDDPANRLYFLDVLAGGPTVPLTAPQSGLSPFAHPDGNFYWTQSASGQTEVWKLDPTAGTPERLTTLDTSGGSRAYYEDRLIQFNTSDPATAYQVKLASGTTALIPASLSNDPGVYAYAAPEADLHRDVLPGGAYGKANSFLRLRASADTPNGYRFGLHLVSSDTANSGIESSSWSTLRFNHRRTAIVCYHFQFFYSGILKWFDPSQPWTAAVNRDEDSFQASAPTLDSDSQSFPDQIFPAAVEPFQT